MVARTLFGSGIAAALILLGSTAHAAGTRLEYRAPDGCPAEAGFIAAVEARGASLGAAGERWLDVVIERSDAGFSGRFQLREGETASGPRSVQAPTCAEVSDALAVVTAIALQADAAAPAAVAELPASPAVPAPVAAPSLAAVAPLPPPGEPPHTRGPLRVISKDSFAVPAGTLQIDYLQTYMLSAGVQRGVLEGVTLPRFDFTLARTNVVTTPDSRDFLLGGLYRLRWTVIPNGEHFENGYTSDFWVFKAGGGGCAPFTFDPRGLMLGLCTEIAGGVMGIESRNAEGVKVIKDKAEGVATVGAELVAQYHLGGVFHLGLTAGSELWLTRVTAQAPERENDYPGILQTNGLSTYVTANLSLLFW